MSVDEKVSLLQKFSVFENVPFPVIQALASRMHEKTFQHGDILFEEDVDDERSYFMYTGAVSTFRTTQEGEIVNLDILGAPELVGEMGLIDTKPHVESAVALEETKTLILSQVDFQEFIHENSTLAINMLKLFADRIRSFDVFLEELLSKNLYERTKITLEILAKYFPNQEITLSHEEIADLLWGTRARVTEVLDTLEKEGKIEIRYKKIKVK